MVERCYVLESFECGIGLREIGESAFNNCKELRTITLNEGLERIENNIIMARSVTQITVSEQNEKFKILDDILYEMNGETPYRAVALPSTVRKSDLVIQEGTEVIGDGAFYECSI